MSDQTFEIGEIALYVGTCDLLRGHQVTILSRLHESVTARDVQTGEMTVGPAYEIDAPLEGFGKMFARPCALRKLPGADDGRQISSWDECPWRPTSLIHTAS